MEGAQARARRAQRRDMVKARLGEAMLEVARDRSFSDVTVEEIAAAAGISRSTFYFYYRDKGDLLVDAAREVAGEIFSQGDGYWQGDGDPRALIGDALSRAAGTFAEHAPLLRVTMEVAAYDEMVGEFWHASVQEFIGAVAARIRSDQERGAAPRELDPDRFADALVTATQGYLFRAIGRNGDSPEDVAGVLTEIWTRVLYPAEA